MSDVVTLLKRIIPPVVCSYGIHEAIKRSPYPLATGVALFGGVLIGTFVHVNPLSPLWSPKCSSPAKVGGDEDASKDDRSDIDMIKEEQESIFLQMQWSTLISSAFFSTAAYGFPGALATTIDQRITLALASECLPGLVMLFSIVNVGGKRFPDKDVPAEVTNGGGKTSDLIRFPLSFLSNTHEQLTIGTIARLATAVYVPDQYTMLIPAAAAYFVLGRFAFYHGYQRHPVLRAVGFGMALLPTAAALIGGCVYVGRQAMQW